MNIAFFTLGCKVNQYETEAMREIFEKAGHTVVSDKEHFDVLVINSCTVTAESDRKTGQIVRRFRRENPDAVIVLTGCMVQAFPEKAKNISDVDITVGNTDISKIPFLTEQFLNNKKRLFEVCPHNANEQFNTPNISDFAERTRAYIKIEDGCERYCSYCIIPKARGPVRSKSTESIYSEAAALAENGFAEIVLVGINLSAYGKNENFNLCDAVEAVCSIPEIKRVRLGSLEPDHITDDMLKRLKRQEKFCPQFHLSLQSGCDKTLKRMNRHYDTAFYSDLVSRIRNMFPNASVTTDVMVGFAGETEEEFNESLNFVKSINFAKIHVFAYSRRKGTVAYNLPNQITQAEKNSRSKKMLQVAANSENKFLNSKIGETVPVLFEIFKDGIIEGYTPDYARVAVNITEKPKEKIKNVKIISVEKNICHGILK